MADSLEVMGIGEIYWTFVAYDSTEVQIVTVGSLKEWQDC